MGLLDKKNKKSRAQARRNASGKGPSKPEEPEPSLSQREEEELRAKIRAQMFGDQLKEKIMAKMDEARFGEMQPEDEKPKDESEPETSKTDPIQENEQGNHLGKNAESRADFSLSYRFPSFNKDSDPFEDRASSSTPSGVYKHSPFDDRYALSKDDYSSQTEVLDEYSRVCPDLECDEIEHVDPEATPTKKLFQVPLPSSPSNRADPRAPSSSHFRRPTIEQHISDTLSGFRAIGSISQGQEKATQIPSPNRFTKVSKIFTSGAQTLQNTNKGPATASTPMGSTANTLTPKPSTEVLPRLWTSDDGPAARIDEAKQPFPRFSVNHADRQSTTAYNKVRTLLTDRWFEPAAREEPAVRALRIARSVLREINASFGSATGGTFNDAEAVGKTIAEFEAGVARGREADGYVLESRRERWAVLEGGESERGDSDGLILIDRVRRRGVLDRVETATRANARREKNDKMRVPDYGVEAAWAVRYVEWAEKWEEESRKLREDGLGEMLAARGPQAGEVGWKVRRGDEDEEDDAEDDRAEDEKAEGEIARSEKSEDARERMELWAAEVDAGLQREKERQVKDGLDSKRREAERKAELAAQKEKMNEWNRQLKEMEAKEKQRQKREG